jgi:hypothetical protein
MSVEPTTVPDNTIILLWFFSMNTLDEIHQRPLHCGIGAVTLTEDEQHGLDGELDELLERIAQCPNIGWARSLLDELGSQQEVLATLLFKHKAPLSVRQRRLVRQCDRLDDEQLRAFVFDAIGSGTMLRDDKPPF